jgi:hypothetical protein
MPAIDCSSIATGKLLAFMARVSEWSGSGDSPTEGFVGRSSRRKRLGGGLAQPERSDANAAAKMVRVNIPNLLQREIKAWEETKHPILRAHGKANPLAKAKLSTKRD